jgi:hypothetical protein
MLPPVLRTLVFMYLSVLTTSAAIGQNEVRSRTKVTIIDPEKIILRQVSELPRMLKEASGLAITNRRYLWSHNDGGIPVLYCLDTLGNFVRAVHINASNRGWEDLTMNESEDLFIGSFGNNGNDRRNLKIFILRNPERTENSVVIPEVIEYSYTDQKEFPPAINNRNFDVDAFFAWRNSLYLFTKNRSKPFRGVSKIYKLYQQPGRQTAQLMDSLFVGEGSMINNWITGADLSPDQKTIALLFHDRVWFIRNFTENKFSGGNIYEVPLKHYSHKAGIAFMTNDLLYIVDELELGMIGGKLYMMDLTSLWREAGK